MPKAATVKLPVNGDYQRPDLREGWSAPEDIEPFPEPWEGSFVAIDTETTGKNFYRPLPGFTHPARPFSISCCAIEVRSAQLKEHTHLFTGAVDPQTRAVTWTRKERERFLQLVSQYDVWVFHNALFDLKGLGLLFEDFGTDPYRRWMQQVNKRAWLQHVEDTLAAAHVLDSLESHRLKELAIRYLDMLDDDESILKQRVKEARAIADQRGVPYVGGKPETDYCLPPIIWPNDRSLQEYSVRDAVRTARLWVMQRAALQSEALWPHYVRERRIVWDTLQMNSSRLHFSKIAPALRSAHQQQQAANHTWLVNEATAQGLPDYNPNSAQQLGRLLHDKFNLPVLATTPTGQPSTGANVLDALLVECNLDKRRWSNAIRYLEHHTAYRKDTTACTYLDNYFGHAITDDGKKNGRVWLYPNFNPWGGDNGIRTTRFSSSDPPLQNVERPDKDDPTKLCLRDTYGPPPGYVWYSIDFDQLETRLMARASGDPTLNKIIREGLDVYVIMQGALNTVRENLGQPPREGREGRQWAKAIWLAWQYGLGIKKFSAMAGAPADELMKVMRQRYPGVVAFMDDRMHYARQHGYTETLFGYRLYVPREEPYKATNYTIQGTAGDVCKNSIIACNDYLRQRHLTDHWRLILVIHDELIFEVHKRSPSQRTHLRNIVRIMSDAGTPIDCPTPANASIITTTWGKPQKITKETK